MSLDITKFFKSKKKDLSNNSEESGESSKKQHKGSLNDSSVSENTEVFKCQHSVQLFAKLRKRNQNSQGYSTNNTGKPD